MGLFERYRKNNINESVDWEKSMDGNDNNLDRIKKLKNLQVDIPPVMGDALEDDEKFDKNSKEVFTKLAKDAESVIPKDPDTGKKVTIKPYTEKLTLDENLFKESWITFDGSWKDQTVKKVFYEEDDISDIAERLMNWYGECFEGWEAADIKDALYGLEGERIPGSSCPIVFTMEESEDDELDWDNEDYDESLSNVNEDYNTREYSDQLYDMIEDDMIDAKKIAEDLIYWCSEDDIERYMKINGLIWEPEDEDGAEDSLEEKKSLNKELSLLEYASEDEEDDYTVIDLLNDRLFGYGINKSNFRIKWKFAEVEPTIKTRDGKVKRGYFYPTAQKDEMVTGKADDRRAFVEEGIGVLVHDEDEALLAKKCADELGLEFKMKRLVKPVNGCEYTAVIKVPEDVQEMTVEEYMKSIGKSISDLLRGKGEKVKSNFKDSANYKSRKNKQDSE